jgi:carbon-monoxide dehydrogenase medium subunit
LIEEEEDMKDVIYFAPTSVEEAVRLLAEHGKKVTVVAGGTDLVPRINDYERKPDILVYVGGMPLDYIKEEKGELLIGATTPTAKLMTNALVVHKTGALAEAARLSGSPATRNTGTIGGNLVNASPAADLATPLLIMDAELIVASTNGERAVAIKDFFTGPGETMLKPDELLLEVHVPIPLGKTVFLKLGRRKSMTLSVVNVAVHLIMDGRTCRDARIALGSMAPMPLRCPKAEALLKGKPLDTSLIVATAAEAVSETHPIDDVHARAWYRQRAGTELVARALADAAGVDR